MVRTLSDFQSLIFGVIGLAIFVIGGFFENLALFIPFAVVGVSLVLLGTVIQVKKAKFKRHIYGIIIGGIGLLMILAWWPIMLNLFDFPYSEWVQSAGALLIFVGLLLRSK